MSTGHRRKALAFSALLVATSMFLIEGLSYVYVGYFSEGYLVSSKDLVDQMSSRWLTRYYERKFDSNLGWQPRPNTNGENVNSAGVNWSWTVDRYGARQNPDFSPSLSPYIATFGDSWTYCDGVDDRETWQVRLSSMLGSHVANYGVPAYGTGQAYLRFKEKLEEGLTPEFSMLGIFEGNFERVLNRFRPFYVPATLFKLGFKPRAYLDHTGKLEFKAMPLRDREFDRQALIDAIEAARVGDFWAHYWPRSAFPYSLNLLRAAKLGVCNRNPTVPTCDGSSRPTWESSEVREIMKALVREFVRASRDKDVRPTILFLSSRERPRYAGFVRELRSEYRDEDVPIIDASEAERIEARFRISPGAGHASAYGNEIVAKQIARYFPAAAPPVPREPAIR
jgi:hypothetical protein